MGIFVLALFFLLFEEVWKTNKFTICDAQPDQTKYDFMPSSNLPFLHDLRGFLLF